MSVNHVHAHRCLNTLSILAQRWNITLPDSVLNIISTSTSDGNAPTPTMSLFETHATMASDFSTSVIQNAGQRQQEGYRARDDSAYWSPHQTTPGPSSTDFSGPVFTSPGDLTQTVGQEQQLMWWPMGQNEQSFAMTGAELSAMAAPTASPSHPSQHQSFSSLPDRQ